MFAAGGDDELLDFTALLFGVSKGGPAGRILDSVIFRNRLSCSTIALAAIRRANIQPDTHCPPMMVSDEDPTAG